MSKLWQGRFQTGNHPTMEAFTSSIAFDKELYREDILGSLAHATMLGQTKIVSHEESQTLCAGLRSVLKKIESGTVAFSEADEDIHMNIERLLTQEIGPLAGKLHTGRSRNDQVATDLHLYLRTKTLLIFNGLVDLQKALLSQIDRNGTAILPGYTHLQRAQPVLFAQHLLAYLAMLQRDVERFSKSWNTVNQLPLGAGALAGTKHPIDRELTQKLLGCDSMYSNSMDAVSDRDFATEFLFNCAQVMIHLSRFSEELILWSTQEFAFVEIEDSFCSGSSLMPQKKNPDVPELIRGKCGRVFGSLFSLMTTLKGLPLAYNRDLQEDKEPIFDTVRTLVGTLSVLTPLVESLRISQANMRKAAEKGFMNATDLADFLVEKGVAFREAHGIAGKIVRHCLDSNCTLQELDLATFQGFSSLFTEEVFNSIGLESVVASKQSLGGTCLDQVHQQRISAESRLKTSEIWFEEKMRVVLEAESQLFED